MAALSKYLRSVAGGGLAFWCEGCGEAHLVWTGAGPGPRWSWNGDVERPVFGPSVLVTCGHYVQGFKTGDDCWCTHNAEEVGAGRRPSAYSCQRCHTFVGCNGAQPGEIIFLGDCTHPLAGKVRPLAEMPSYRSTDA